MIYDSVIIGTGPAGLSAALNLKIHEKNFLWIGNKNLSEKVEKAELVKNYPGLLNVTGKELNEAFKRHADEFGLTICEHTVTNIMPMKDCYAVMAGNEFFKTKTVILATGVITVGTILGEEKLVGRGVSYCATCDGGLYKDKTIAVICNAKRFEYEIDYLSNLAQKVYYFPMYKDVASFSKNVEIQNSKVQEIKEENGKASCVVTADGTIKVDGVFCIRNNVSLALLLPSLETEDSHIKVNRNMETSLKGVFACGDCTGRPYQYTKAVGEGNVAAHSVIEYLSNI